METLRSTKPVFQICASAFSGTDINPGKIIAGQPYKPVTKQQLPHYSTQGSKATCSHTQNDDCTWENNRLTRTQRALCTPVGMWNVTVTMENTTMISQTLKITTAMSENYTSVYVSKRNKNGIWFT